MLDRESLSTFEKHVLDLNLLTEEQIAAGRAAMKTLQQWGFTKSLEEIVLLLGQMDFVMMESVLDDIKRSAGISIARPVIHAASPEKDRDLQESLRKKGPEAASQVLECQQLQTKARKLGIQLSLWEILDTKGFLEPRAAAPARPAPSALPPKAARRPAHASEPARRPAIPAKTPPTARKEVPPARNRNLVLGLSIGGAAAVLLIGIVLMSGKKEEEKAPVAEIAEPRGDEVQLWSDKSDKVSVYSEANLLAIHMETKVKADHQLPKGTRVAILGHLSKIWFQVRTAKGLEGWVSSSALRTREGYDFREKPGEDLLTGFTAKLAAKKGVAPTALAAVPPPPEEPVRPVEAPKPAEPAPVAKVPEKPAEPEPPARPAEPVPQEEKPVLAGHWKLDEGVGARASDAAGKNHGVVVGAAWVPGRDGKALRFDGVKDVVKLGTAGLPASNAPQSITGWFAVPSVPAAVQTMVGLTSDTSGVQVGFRDSKLSVWKHGGVVLASADAPPNALAGAKNGLLGTYYDNQDLTAPSLRRIDPQVNFDWREGPPDPSMGNDSFSIRWVGQIEPQHSETYTFYLLSDDGVRLWIDGKPVIDHWVNQAPSESKGTAELKAGQRADIRLEYFDGNSHAQVRLSWSSAKQLKEFVPTKALFPPSESWNHFAYTFDGTTHKLYLNGAPRNSSTTAPSTGEPSTFELGRWEGKGLKEFFKGSLDDVRVYSKCLEDYEVRDLAPDADVAMAAAGRPAGARVPLPPGVLPGPPPPDAAKQVEREKKAQELWDAALELEKQGKMADAQAKLKELRTRYRGTSVYFDKMIEISDKINEWGKTLAVGSLDKAVPYKRPHVDSWYGYEFCPPDGWKGIPPAQAYFGDEDSSEINYKGQTIRIARYTSDHFSKLYMQVYKSFAATDLADLETKVMRYQGERYGNLTEVKDDAPPDKKPGKMPFVRKLYEGEQGDRFVCYFYYQDKRALALVGVWRAGSEDGGFFSITIVSGGVTSKSKSKDQKVTSEEFGHALKVFDASARTFWIYDAATRSGKRVQLDKGALCSDWNIMKSSRGSYLIEYATRPDYAKRAGDELEQILALYRQVIPSQKGIPQCRVKIFDREEDFMYYGQMPGAAAYWSPSQEEIVCYRFEGDKVKLDDSKSYTVAEDKNPEEVTFKILYHEGFHQYMYYLMGRDRRVYVPSWINEGLGDYFFGGQWQKSPRKFAIGVNDWRVKVIHKAVKENKHVPLKDIFRYEQSQYYSKASLCYAEGWSINYFFLTSEVAKKKGYASIPSRMLDALKTGGDWERATDKVFAGIDLKKMEEEWKEFVLALPVPPPKPGEMEEEEF